MKKSDTLLLNITQINSEKLQEFLRGKKKNPNHFKTQFFLEKSALSGGEQNFCPHHPPPTAQ